MRGGWRAVGETPEIKRIRVFLVDLFGWRVAYKWIPVLFDISFDCREARTGAEGSLGKGGRAETVGAS